jgi:Holliday junction resolvasome RuvABC ATP-dependent DNA helicase subunit
MPNPIESPFHPAFAGVVGQNNVKSAFSLSLSNAARMVETGEKIALTWPLLLGEAGLGKTNLAEIYGRELASILKVPFIRVENPEEIRLKVDFDKWFARLESEASFVLFLDEVHEMKPNQVSHLYLKSFLMKMGDPSKIGTSIQVGSNFFVPDRSNKVIILGTNQAGKVDPAILSRWQTFNLSLYNNQEILQIAKLLVSKYNLTVEDDKILALISGCGRGTARPIVNLLNDSILPLCISQGTTTISRDIVLEALRQQEMFPLGFNKAEVEMISKLGNSTVSKMRITAMVPALEGVLTKAIAYACNMNVMKVENNGHLALTKTGKAYKNKIEEMGFTF